MHTDTQREIHTERQTHTEIRETDTHRERQIHTETHRERHPERQTHTHTHGHMCRKSDNLYTGGCLSNNIYLTSPVNLLKLSLLPLKHLCHLPPRLNTPGKWVPVQCSVPSARLLNSSGDNVTKSLLGFIPNLFASIALISIITDINGSGKRNRAVSVERRVHWEESIKKMLKTMLREAAEQRELVTT